MRRGNLNGLLRYARNDTSLVFLYKSFTIDTEWVIFVFLSSIQQLLSYTLYLIFTESFGKKRNSGV
jgi:hypothetical protein